MCFELAVHPYRKTNMVSVSVEFLYLYHNMAINGKSGVVVMCVFTINYYYTIKTGAVNKNQERN